MTDKEIDRLSEVYQKQLERQITEEDREFIKRFYDRK